MPIQRWRVIESIRLLIIVNLLAWGLANRSTGAPLSACRIYSDGTVPHESTLDRAIASGTISRGIVFGKPGNATTERPR